MSQHPQLVHWPGQIRGCQLGGVATWPLQNRVTLFPTRHGKERSQACAIWPQHLWHPESLHPSGSPGLQRRGAGGGGAGLVVGRGVWGTQAPGSSRGRQHRHHELALAPCQSPSHLPPPRPHAAVPVAGNICSAAPLPRRVRVRGSRQDPRPVLPGLFLTVTLMRGGRVSGADGWDWTDRRASECHCPRQGPATPRVTSARRSHTHGAAPCPLPLSLETPTPLPPPLSFWGWTEDILHPTSCLPLSLFPHLVSYPCIGAPRLEPCSKPQMMPHSGMAPRALFPKKGTGGGRAGVTTAAEWGHDATRVTKMPHIP